MRVGDPNQAIYETFTTANPRYLREFLQEPDVLPQELPTSGRSTPSIIALANHLIEWTRAEHLNQAVRDALSLPLIEPTGPDDPQPNPTDDPTQVFLVAAKIQPGRRDPGGRCLPGALAARASWQHCGRTFTPQLKGFRAGG